MSRFDTVLIANRGEIAVRIARTLKRMGIRSVAVYSEADRNSAHVAACDAAVCIGPAAPAESYLRGDHVIAAAHGSGAQAVIPGYGFLSENTAFAQSCAHAGLVFIGPTPEQIRRFGLKHESREIARAAGVPLTPGTGLLGSVEEAIAAAAQLGYPVMLKSTAGGGGIGLTRCTDAAALAAAYESVQRLGKSFFNDAGVFLERCIDNARHVEVQIFGDGRGQVIALGERDCSVQRRNQKVIEETPAPRLPPATRAALLQAAVDLGRAVGYSSAGTVEFIYDAARDAFYFLEVNTRLQVEHPITEAVTGVDLVEWMVLTAAGEPPDLAAFRSQPQGAALEVRIYAEDPVRNFQPSPGVLTEVMFPPDARVDGWVATGTEVTPHYDPMLAKLIVHGADRAAAVAAMQDALAQTHLSGIATNVDYLRQILASERFKAGEVSTRFLDTFAYAPRAIEVLEPGTYTTVQDYPGRVGYWDVGVPPSGPMDDYAFRMANRIVGNGPDAAGLECTILGPGLRFHGAAVVALAGDPAAATLDGLPVAPWTPLEVKAGQTLRIGKVASGCRIYLAVRGGIDVPAYLGSKSTFALGQFGGHAGRPVRGGDLLRLGDAPAASVPAAAPAALVPAYGSEWNIGVLYGPHGAPDFFTEASIRDFFTTAWEVHYNSNRLGVRLVGPKPSWTRSDGGEAGLHPSNIHDCEYAIGSINFTGDMPVILTRDGPSLGGFVCPVTIAKAELWKVGQVKPGDRIRFRRIGFEQALELERAQDAAIERLAAVEPAPIALAMAAPRRTVSETVIAELPRTTARPQVAYRQAGDRYILIEYGPMVLDLALRMRVHALMQELRARPIPGILELSPGVRSLQVHYDSRTIPQGRLMDALLKAEERLPPVDDMKVPTRVVHLPMAWQDSATLDAVARYRQSVRDTAPWLPSNVEFMRRINGLDSVEQVRDIVFQASYLVLGLGDVYLGAPCAVPVDPRHRLLTSKYNPARTYTAEGTVGIGGVYMCIYGMDSPGGYQLVGRTLPIWNKFLKNPVFKPGEPWLLRFFDQVRFYPVEEAELTEQREAFREGRLAIDIREEVFDFAAYNRFLAQIEPDVARFRARQKVAFDAEVAHWQAGAGAAAEAAEEVRAAAAEPVEGHVVAADISGNVWKLLAELGAEVRRGEALLVIEAMKMEFAVHAPVTGVVRAVHCRQGRPVSAGEVLIVIAEAELP
ncbi:MAG: urea carboxylase [Nevskia sp.]|nr:urea carboxylase [Nevskia sp.]